MSPILIGEEVNNMNKENTSRCSCPHRDRVIAPGSWWFHLGTDALDGELQYVIAPITHDQAKKVNEHVDRDDVQLLLVVGAPKGKPTLQVSVVEYMNHEWVCPRGLGLRHRYTPIVDTAHVDFLLIPHTFVPKIESILGRKWEMEET
jgi:hypothetical protein